MAKVGYGSVYGAFCIIVTIILAGLFVYRSWQPAMHLRTTPPAEFLDARPNWTTAQRQAEERLGRAYWDVAVKLSRSVFVYGDRLPPEPPAVFSVDPKEYPSAVESAGEARLRYWRNLQKVWYGPQSWQRTYEWHTDWLTRGNAY
jgi:hypothetical protein